VGLVFAYLLGHPTIGLGNTNTSPDRLFGWLFYFFVEGYSPFVVSVFWAFANSITDPTSAKKHYGIMVSGSKLGGMFSLLCAWLVLNLPANFGGMVFSDTYKHQLLLVLSSLFLFVAPWVIVRLMKVVPGHLLHGYEAAYQVEKKRAKSGGAQTGILSGLSMFIRYPYILGIFSMIFFYEVINTVLSYHRIAIAQTNASSVSDVTGFLFKISFATHFVGFFFSLFGTGFLLRRLGERLSLILIPVLTGILLLYFTYSYTPMSVLMVFVAIRVINYAFSYPVRESLYIPTVKEMKFKSKSWIDTFGSKFAKAGGSTFTIFAEGLSPALFLPIHMIFFAGLVCIWTVSAFLLGKKYESVIENNEVIGVEPENDSDDI